MKKFKWKQIGSAVIAAALMGSMVLPIVSQAQEEIARLQAGSTNQTSTAPEQIMLNNYNGAKRSENFNNNWKFYLGEAGNAQVPEFDDSGWDRVTLPHDYSIDQKYNPKLEGESGYLPGGTGWYRKSFTVNESLKDKRISIDFGGVYMNATVYLNGKQLGTHPYGYTPFSFDITNDVKFGEENVLAVKVEHKTPSSRFYSGSGIYRDVDLVVTDAVHVDKNGTKVETPKLSEHANGKNVPVNIKTTVVNNTETDANVKVQHTVYPKGGSVEQKVGTFTTGAETVSANKSAVINADFTVDGVSLWTVKSKNPQMYVVRTEVLVEDKVVDTYETDYGFRFFNFDKDKGFSLNGENMKLKGVCMHHDQGALGAVANDRSTERQVEIMKNMGVNSIRVTHNPASRELIDACNKHGILLVEEAFDGWVSHKNGNSQDYAGWFNTKIKEDNQIIGGNKDMTWAQFDLTAMIKRGQNAPSIIMWSLGNEMWEGTGGYNSGFKTAQDNLIKWAKELDKTRPVTTGDNKLKGGDFNAKKLAGDLHTAGGAVGLNYASGGVYDQIHNSYPEWRMYGSETASAVNSRGIYQRERETYGHNYGNYELTSYDTSKVPWGAVASDAWYQIIQRDYLAGEYVWTGFDYLGEPTPWNDDRGTMGSRIWPAPKNSYFGIVDTAGLPKDTYYFYQSQWNDDVHTLHILPAWNENVVDKDRSGNVPVVVYTDAKKVELWFQDAKGGEPTKIGTKEFTSVKSKGDGYTYQMYQGEDKSRTEHENLYLRWMVPYKDGTIFAKAFDAEGNEIKTNLQGRTSVTTAGAAKKLEAKADRTTITADGQDLSYITVSVTDEKGNLVPDAANKVSFKVTGDGVLAGVDNGQQIDHQSFRDNNRKAFSGQLVGIVRSTKAAGTINVEITADNLQKQNITITTQASATNPESEKAISSVTMPKNYYVKVGVKPELPNQLEVILNDGTKSNANVVWKEIPADKYGNAGSFTVSGTITAPGVEQAETIYVNINMIDTVAAIMNYSTTTTVGVAPKLPESRPAVKADGTVLTASFPVKWNDSGVKYDQAGIVKVEGTAEVFGTKMPVVATVRVQEIQYTVGENVAKEAMKLEQDLTVTSDTLEAIRDGKRTASNVNSGPNPSLWSNYENSKQNREDKDAEIIFTYATLQTLNQIKIFFRQDNWSASYPEEGKTEIYVSTAGGDSWTKLEVEETIGETKGDVREYTYDFAPTGAVAIKLKVVNNSTRTTNSGFTCTAITEAELYRANTADFVANTTAKLESLAFGEVKAPASALEAGSWSTSAKTAENMTIKTADNASVTVLPAVDGMIRMILESEDNKTQKTFIVNLDADPTDASQDYAGNVAYKAGSAQTANNNGIEKAFDRDEQSYWHTAWGAAADAKNRWVEMTLEEPQYMTGLRYLPRPAGGQGSSNGNVLNYRIEVRNSETEDWQPVKITDGTSEWSKDGGWKLAKFATPVEAKYVRFVGVRTHDDTGSNMHMNAAEIRLKVTEKPTVTGLQIEQNPTKNTYLENEKFEPAGLVVALKYSDGSKGQRVEYNAENAAKFTFEPNLETALVKGQDKISVTFEGQKADIAIKVIAPESLEVYNGPSRMQYTEGEHFNPAGLEVQIKYSDGTLGEKVVYSTANAGEFTFEPDLNTALTAGTHMATVTYQGLKANLGNITVNEKTPVDPEPPVDPEMPVVTEITVSTPPAKTEYKAGEKFDPTGLVLNVTIEDGTTGEVPYRPETAEFFSFEPGLDTALTAGTQKVTVTFGGKTAEITISVKNADGTTPNGGSDGTTTPNGNGPAQTGDTFNSGLVIGICVVSAVAICVIVVVLVKKNKKNKN